MTYLAVTKGLGNSGRRRSSGGHNNSAIFPPSLFHVYFMATTDEGEMTFHSRLTSSLRIAPFCASHATCECFFSATSHLTPSQQTENRQRNTCCLPFSMNTTWNVLRKKTSKTINITLCCLFIKEGRRDNIRYLWVAKVCEHLELVLNY